MFTMNCRGSVLVVDKPIVMGIINLTPDSFYSGSRHSQADEILRKAEEMLKEGASILDIGGQSTRPGSIRISAEEELKRVLEPLESIHKNFPDAIISIDSFYGLVARRAIEAGAHIVNDISAGSGDPAMIETVAELGTPYVLMHMQGEPSTMQANPGYENVTKEVLDFFIERTYLIRKAGIKDIIIDPGFGFGKRHEHNFELLRNLSVFKILDLPILLGLSRKSMISKILDVSITDSLNGTTVLNTIGLLNGAAILRVHDVKEARQAIELFWTYTGKTERTKAPPQLR